MNGSAAGSAGEPTGGAGPLVDCHAHAWGEGMPFLSNAWRRPDYCYTAENFLADMDVHGISFGVIAAASLFGTYNDYTIRALRRHRRLRGTAILDPATGLHELEAMRLEGITGVRLQWFALDPLPDVSKDEWQRFFHRLRDLGMHVHLNIEGRRLADAAAPVLGTGVRLVIDHHGWHDPARRLEEPSYRAMLVLMEPGTLWVKLSSGFRLPDRDLPAEYAQDLLARFGPERLLWGSDAPFVGHEHAASYSDAVADFTHAVPDPETREAIGRTALDFYFGDVGYNG